MLTNSRSILARLQREGWIIARIKGSHHILRKAGFKVIVVLPHPEKDLPLGTVRNIYRSAG